MLPVCAFLPPNVPLEVESSSAIAAPAPRTMSSAAPRPLVVVVVVVTVVLRLTAPETPWPINAPARQISSAVFPRLAAVAAAAEAAVTSLRRPFQRLVHARRKQSMVRGRLSQETQVLSVRFTVPGLAHVALGVITVAAWPRI